MDKDVVYLYRRIWLNHKKEIMPFSTTWMDQDIITLNEVHQRKTNINIHHLFVELKKKWYKWTFLQSINRFTDVENKFIVTKEGRKIN